MNAETFSGLWYINKPFASRMEGIILPRLQAGIDPIPSHFRPNAAISWTDKDGDYSPTRDFLRTCLKAGGGDVAVIPINGTMSRYGMCGMGNEFIIQLLAEAAEEKAVKAVVLKGNTPGGTVDSIEMLADAIRNFPKATVGYINGSVASAGVFAFSQTSHTMIENSESSEYGSIGVLMVHVDQSLALKNAGLVVRIFRAGESIDKATINGIEPLTPELEAEIQSNLDSKFSLFRGVVIRGRAGKLKSEDVFSGKMYNKKDNLKYGLVDSAGLLADAIKVARKL